MAAVLLAAPSLPRVAAKVSLPQPQATGAARTRAGTVVIRFSELAEVTTANVSGLLPLVARSVAVTREDPRIDPSAPIDLPLQRFVDERTATMGLPTRGRNRPVSYLLESVSEEPSSSAELRARDPSASRVLWSVHEALPIASGALITAGGLVFYGTGDGWFKALDARSGQTLWKHWVEGRRFDAPASYRGADGHQYVAVRALPRTPREGGETVLLFALAH